MLKLIKETEMLIQIISEVYTDFVGFNLFLEISNFNWIWNTETKHHEIKSEPYVIYT